jgi:hypothetical protein|tara:strand:- start:2672 stop:3640 length:969 start_codon:yes stop_codon:yes gene_type:complete
MSTEQITSSPMSEATEDENFQDEPTLEINVVDDVPEEDRGRVAPGVRSVEDHEEELGSVSNNVQKRIKKLKYDFHEERRAKETSSRMRDEAVNYASKVQKENERLRDLVNRGEVVLLDEVKTRTEKELESARFKLKRAHEEGDPDSIVNAQELLSIASYDSKKIQEYTPSAQEIPKQESPQVRPQVQVDKRASEWAMENSWFRSDKEMTAVALAVHEDLISNGVDPKSDNYYQTIDNRIRDRFPEKFGGDSPEVVQVSSDSVLRSDGNRRKPSTVVAPARRTTGARSRKVQLTKTQVSLAKRLGVSPENYAKQLLKLENNNG